MADASTLKEFLVELGFRVDQPSFKKFDDYLLRATGGVGKIALGVVAAAAAVETFVVKSARAFDKLYWAAQRVGSSVEQIQGFELAIRSMGGGAEDARAALEGMAAAMRTNPGLSALVASLTGKSVAGRGGAEIMVDLARRFSQMPYFVAARYASMLGIPEATLWQMTHNLPQFTSQMRTTQRLYGMAGLDATAVSGRLHNFVLQWNKLEQSVGILATGIADSLLPATNNLTRGLQGAVEWLLKFRVGDTEFFKSVDWEAVGKEIEFVKGALVGLGRAIVEGVDWDSVKKVFLAVGQGLEFVYRNIDWRAVGKELEFFKNALAGAVGGLVNFWQFLFGTGKEPPPHSPDMPNQRTGYAAGKVGGQASGFGKFQGGLLELVRRLENSGDDAVSKAGAVGRYQIKPDTARMHGFKDATADKLKDPAYNTRVALKILSDLSRDYGGNLEKILVAYNAGPGWLNPTWLAKHNRKLGDVPTETMKYLQRERGLTGNAPGPVNFHVPINIKIDGAKDPKAVAEEVAQATSRSIGDIVRNLRGNYH